MGGGSDLHIAPFRVGEATKSSHIEPIPHYSPIGAPYKHHFINHDIGSAKCPPEKQTHSHWTVETLCIDSY